MGLKYTSSSPASREEEEEEEEEDVVKVFEEYRAGLVDGGAENC